MAVNSYNPAALRLGGRRRWKTLRELASLPLTARPTRCKRCGEPVFSCISGKGGWITMEPLAGPYSVIGNTAHKLPSGKGDWARHDDLCAANRVSGRPAPQREEPNHES